ncbi:MAG: ATP-binding protein [Bacteroidales bacterium]|nr:ATP-binding protein [Bacteroidales bacterium]
MATINNPFIIKGAIPAEYFCDRVKETEILTNHIHNGRNVVLTAPRRIGKTGLIAHCFQTPKWEEEYYVFFIDILETSSLRDLTFALGRQIFETLKPKSKQMVDLFVQTVRSISGEFGYDILTGMPKFTLSLGAIRNPEYTLAEIFEYINQADKRCLIAIDEFQQIVHYPEKNIEAILRTHIQHCTNADFIFAGSERHILEEMFNLPSRPFYASTANMNLEAISQDIYTEFVLAHFQEFNKHIEATSVEYVYRMFDGNTYCMQKVMNVAFAMTEENELCTQAIVEQAINDILSENERNYKNRLSLLTPKPKELLIAIAKEGKASRVTSGDFVRRYHLTSSSSVQSALKQLLADDWITYTANEQGQKQYLLSDPFLSRWVQQNF